MLSQEVLIQQRLPIHIFRRRIDDGQDSVREDLGLPKLLATVLGRITLGILRRGRFDGLSCVREHNHFHGFFMKLLIRLTTAGHRLVIAISVLPSLSKSTANPIVKVDMPNFPMAYAALPFTNRL